MGMNANDGIALSSSPVCGLCWYWSWVRRSSVIGSFDGNARRDVTELMGLIGIVVEAALLVVEAVDGIAGRASAVSTVDRDQCCQPMLSTSLRHSRCAPFRP